MALSWRIEALRESWREKGKMMYRKLVTSFLAILICSWPYTVRRQEDNVVRKFFDPRPSTNQSTSLKSGSLFLVMVSVRPYIRMYVQNKTKQTDQTVKPLFKLVIWLVLGRGSLYDSSLVVVFSYAMLKFF